MRKLLPHPLCAVKRPLLWASIVILLFSIVVHALPLPIGALNDYGNVLDRHGRERINALIAQAKARYGIDVTILASWENPYDSIDQYAYAILDSWGLSRGNALLAVFLKQGRNWEAKILGGEREERAHPGLTARVEKGIRDLVAHRRIAEAMVALFATLDVQVQPGNSQQAGAEKGSRALWIVLLVLGVALGALFISRRICPRCGHILRRRTRPSFRSYGEEDVVYYCKRCGYTRTVTRKRGPRGRGG